MSATVAARFMFEVGDPVSFDTEDGSPVRHYRVTSVEMEAGEYVVRMCPVTEPARDGEEAEA